MEDNGRESMSYWICRHYADGRPSELVKKVNSLSAAQDHCNDPKTAKAGEWFDGYTDKKPLCAENSLYENGLQADEKA